MSGVRLEGISSSYGDVQVLKSIELTIEEGNLVTILGASGSGKTTCLRVIAGFVKPTAGRVFIGQVDVTAIPPHRRNTGIVFQHYALFPHLTVEENVAYGLSVRRLPKHEVWSRAQEALKLVRLEDLAQRYPKQLSGGQKQRVALARAVVIKPKVLLLDEPLGALDLKLREELQTEIRRVQQTLGITTLSVTHDQGEALSMSDQVVVMRDGRILQVDSPVRLYQAPTSVYVARFVGQMNLLRTIVSERDETFQRYKLTHAAMGAEKIEVFGHQSADFPPGSSCFVVFRPEDARFGPEFPNRISAKVEKITYQGDRWSVSCTIGDGNSISVALMIGSTVPVLKEAVTVSWPGHRCLLLNDDEDRR